MGEPEYPSVAGRNFYREDPLLSGWLSARLGPEEFRRLEPELDALGAACGGRLGAAITAAHREGAWPRLEKYDRLGARVDRVAYSAEQLEARRLAHAFKPLPPRPLLARMAMAYLLNINGEGGITCPLAMTDGLVQLLESHGTPEQKRRYLPLLVADELELPLGGGQFVTERHSGSNVAENETRAEPQADGSWRLWGLKWFCSNPGTLWVTTAKPAGSERVGLFLVPRLKPDGSLNECHILRLKDLSGTRGKATAEVEYRGAYAEPVGRLSHGLALLLRSVLRVSRYHVAAASLGFLRRAEWEAKLFAGARRAGGRPVAELPAVRRQLERLEAWRKACFLAVFEMLDRLEREDPAAEALVPLLKVSVSRLATQGVREARLVLAGHGTVLDYSPLPRLAEDALIQEIWEGTHPVLAEHALKALRRPPCRESFSGLLAPDGRAALARALEGGDALTVCEAAWDGLSAALLDAGPRASAGRKPPARPGRPARTPRA